MITILTYWVVGLLIVSTPYVAVCRVAKNNK